MDKDQRYHDDGRTIADMSDIQRSSLLRSRKGSRASKPLPQGSSLSSLSKSERSWVIRGALSAALLIALAFIVGLGIVILLFTLLL